MLVSGGAKLAQAQDAAVPAFKQLDSIDARVQGCVTCHGQSGQGTNNGYFPRIAGKPAGYLYNQLVAFRDGTRRYPPMNYLVAYLPDDYLCEIAEHFSRQSPPLAARDLAPAADAQLQRGQQLVTVGDPGRGVPACAACHGARLTGMIPGIPGLIGLRPTYIAAGGGAARRGPRLHEAHRRALERGRCLCRVRLACPPGLPEGCGSRAGQSQPHALRVRQPALRPWDASRRSSAS